MEQLPKGCPCGQSLPVNVFHVFSFVCSEICRAEVLPYFHPFVKSWKYLSGRVRALTEHQMARQLQELTAITMDRLRACFPAIRGWVLESRCKPWHCYGLCSPTTSCGRLDQKHTCLPGLGFVRQEPWVSVVAGLLGNNMKQRFLFTLFQPGLTRH